MYSEKFYHFNIYSKLEKNIDLQNNKIEENSLQQDAKFNSNTIKYIASTKYLPDFKTKAIDESEMLVVLYYGLYSDSGTAWEQGYAYAKGKQVQVINMGCIEASLMVVNGQTYSDSKEFAEVA